MRVKINKSEEKKKKKNDKLYKLSDINIDFVSVLHGENSSPANPGAVTLFVKSKEKEDIDMAKPNGAGPQSPLMTFLNKLRGVEEKPATEDLKKSDTETKEGETTEPQYMTKEDLSAELEGFKKALTVDLIEVLKGSVVTKTEFKGFIDGLADAHKEEMSGLKKSLIGESRQDSPLLKDQTGLKDLLAHAGGGSQTIEPFKAGTIVDEYIEKNIPKEEMERRGAKKASDELDQVLDLLVGLE